MFCSLRGAIICHIVTYTTFSFLLSSEMSAFEDSNHYEVCPTSPTNAGYALMIGNGIYCDGSNLSGVNSDLILMKTVLTSSGYIVEFEENFRSKKN